MISRCISLLLLAAVWFWSCLIRRLVSLRVSFSLLNASPGGVVLSRLCRVTLSFTRGFRLAVHLNFVSFFFFFGMEGAAEIALSYRMLFSLWMTTVAGRDSAFGARAFNFIAVAVSYSGMSTLDHRILGRLASSVVGRTYECQP